MNLLPKVDVVLMKLCTAQNSYIQVALVRAYFHR